MDDMKYPHIELMVKNRGKHEAFHLEKALICSQSIHNIVDQFLVPFSA